MKRFTGTGLEEELLSNGRMSHNMFKLMVATFSEWWVVIVYVVGCISLSYHLLHGFQSAFRTLGLSNSRYISLVNALGVGFSVIVPLIFALMPISMKMGWVG